LKGTNDDVNPILRTLVLDSAIFQPLTTLKNKAAAKGAIAAGVKKHADLFNADEKANELSSNN